MDRKDEVDPKDLRKAQKRHSETSRELDEAIVKAGAAVSTPINDFGLRLLRALTDGIGENVIVSPVASQNLVRAKGNILIRA